MIRLLLYLKQFILSAFLPWGCLVYYLFMIYNFFFLEGGNLEYSLNVFTTDELKRECYNISTKSKTLSDTLEKPLSKSEYGYDKLKATVDKMVTLEQKRVTILHELER